jgi:hypothetical protein
MRKAETILTAVVLLAILAGCAPERHISWVPPQGISGREVIRDKATCRQMSDPGFVSDSLMGAAIYEQASANFIGCMQEAGYTAVSR